MSKPVMRKVNLLVVKEGDDVTLDYRKTMIEQVRRANDQHRGMDFVEIESLRPIMQKLTAAESGSAIYLEEAEFKIVCDKIRRPFLLAYNEHYDQYIQNVLASENVAMQEETPPGLSAVG